MKRKYYMRGLGFGILVTAIVFAIVKPGKMTDEQVIKRAIELGYSKADPSPSGIKLDELMKKPEESSTNHSVTSESENASMLPEAPTKTITPMVTPEVTLTPTPVPTFTPTPIPIATSIPLPTSTPIPVATSTPLPTLTPTPTAVPTPTEQMQGATEKERITATIVVAPKMGSEQVSMLIQSKGIIKDSTELSNYFVEHGLDGLINVGTFILNSDMTIEEIAKILTSN